MLLTSRFSVAQYRCSSLLQDFFPPPEKCLPAVRTRVTESLAAAREKHPGNRRVWPLAVLIGSGGPCNKGLRAGHFVRGGWRTVEPPSEGKPSASCCNSTGSDCGGRFSESGRFQLRSDSDTYLSGASGQSPSPGHIGHEQDPIPISGAAIHASAWICR